MVYTAEEKTEVLMGAAVMSAGSEVVLGNYSIMINGIKYLNSELKSLLSKSTITRLDFNPAMAQRMIDFAKAAGMIITPTVLKSIGVAVAGESDADTIAIGLGDIASRYGTFKCKESRISENGYHYGVEYNGNVFCNVHPFGLPRNFWEVDFWGIDQASRIITSK